MPIALKQPKFRGCCVFVGVVQCVLALSVLVRGVEVLAPFGVPESTLVSPHFGDAIYWVYTHMVVLGALIIAIGLRVTDPAARTTLSRLLFVAHAYYT